MARPASSICSSSVEKRRYAIVIVFVIAAVLTPPDVISQLALAILTLALYEASIWCVRMVEKKRARRSGRQAPRPSRAVMPGLVPGIPTAVVNAGASPSGMAGTSLGHDEPDPMHDIRFIRDNPQAFDDGLAKRGLAPMAAQLIALDEERRRAIAAAQRRSAATRCRRRSARQRRRRRRARTR